MPQMAPISWLILFFIFSCAFIMFNILNYFCKPSKQTNNNNNNNNMNENKMNLNYSINNNKNWKW